MSATTGSTSYTTSGSYKRQPLYGGAMSALLPKEFDDASNFRQVPDHQEVWVHQETGACVITEINQLEDNVSDLEAAEYHFKDLAKAADAKEVTVKPNGTPGSLEDGTFLLCGPIPTEERKLNKDEKNGGKELFAGKISGTHLVAKFNEDGRENVVRVYVAVFRIPPPGASDIVISVSAPLQVAEGSSEDRAVKAILTDEQAEDLFKKVYSSLSLDDWGLFA